MDCQEFLYALKDSGSKLVAELEGLRGKHNLDKLYLIFINETDAAWGLRALGAWDDKILRAELLNLVQCHTGLHYNSEGKNLIIFTAGIEEVNYVISKELIPFIESEGGELKIISINEGGGEILVSLKGACETCPHSITTMQQGLKKTLTSMLPWVKKVRSVDDPEEPDFGIRKVLDEDRDGYQDQGGEG